MSEASAASADSIVLVEFDGGNVSYDSDMPIGALRKIVRASSKGDFDALIAGLTGFVTSWSFPGTPSDESAWDSLKRSQFNAVVTAVTGNLAAQGEA